MTISLYDLSVTTYLQTLGAVNHFLERGAAHCTEKNIPLEEIVETRIYEDMQPFRYQIQAVVHHALGTLEAIKTGSFSPPRELARHDYKGLQALVGAARETLKQLTADEVNARSGAELNFIARDLKLAFRTEDFVISFSVPNLHFHATTAYDILRSKGVPIGKRDYMGRLRLKS